MAATAENVTHPLVPPNLERIVLAQAEQWLAQCHSFRQWYRERFLLKQPTADERELADQIQPWMIRITRALLSQILDPEFPHRHIARSVETMLWQLEEDWAARHNPMSAAEADSVIEDVFPDHAS
jgi:hypothetical protein